MLLVNLLRVVSRIRDAGVVRESVMIQRKVTASVPYTKMLLNKHPLISDVASGKQKQPTRQKE